MGDTARKISGLLVFLMGLVFAGCGTHQKMVSPPVTMPDSLSGDGTQTIPDRWWITFDDPQLNAMVDTALKSNFSLKTGWQRLRAARAAVDRESASLLPSIDGSARAGVRQNLGDVQESGNLGLGLSSAYEVDLWGRIRANVEAAQYRAKATLADYQAAAISLSAEITRNWYRLVEQRSQLELVKKQIETNETMLKLLENRFGTGQIRSVDILRQRQLLASTREQKAKVESRIQVLEHRLAVLLANTPQAGIQYGRQTLPSLPPLPETGIPIDLVRRRPDVKSAFRQLKAADRELAAAISNQYPRLTLSASVSSAADNASNLFKEWALSFTGNLLAPIFSGGELQAEVDRSEAIKKQRLFEYGQAVLTAFKEVENALIREKKQRQRLQSLAKQIKLARQSYQQLRLEYFNGISDYLDVLTALDEVQQLQRDRLSAKLTLIEYRIALYRALAGDFLIPKGRRTNKNS